MEEPEGTARRTDPFIRDVGYLMPALGSSTLCSRGSHSAGRCGIALGLCLLLAAISAPSASAGGSFGTVRVPYPQAVIVYGSSAGIVAGLCGDKGPKVTDGYSVGIFRGGRAVSHGAAQAFRRRPLDQRAVRRLVQRARRDHFFHLPARMRDTNCGGGATMYIQIRAANERHTVQIYGYLDYFHPQIRDLLNALWTVTGLNAPA